MLTGSCDVSDTISFALSVTGLGATHAFKSLGAAMVHIAFAAAPEAMLAVKKNIVKCLWLIELFKKFLFLNYYNYSLTGPSICYIPLSPMPSRLIQYF